MKTLTCSILLAIFSITAYAQVDLNDQLVAWYPLNGSAVDASGNGFTGIGANVTASQNRAGNAGQASDFNGTSSQIYIPGGFPNISLPITFSAWFNKDGDAADQLTAIFATGDSQTQYTGFFASFDDAGRFTLSYGDGGSPGESSRKGLMAVNGFIEDEWVHVVGIINSDTDMALFVNGQPALFDIVGTGGATMATSTFNGKIGNYGLGVNAAPYKGGMDDVRIYDRAINELEVLALYQESFVEQATADIMITELMVNPDVIQDNDGEWFEIVNAGDEDVDISGWTLRDDGFDFHIISPDNPFVIKPTQIRVFCIQDDQTLNGDLLCDYEYGGMIMDRFIDQVILEDTDNNVVDRVDYNRLGEFPALAGVSMFFTGGPDDDNNIGSFWELAFERTGNYQNDDCPECNELGSPGIIDNPLLPVELTAFDGLVDGTSVHLEWETGTELNNAGFEVQKKQADGVFTAVGWVAGNGTTAETVSYDFTVANLAPGNHIFRLKQVDFDGSFEFSDELLFTIESESGYYVGTPYPNPFNPTTRISFSVEQAQPVRVEVYDMLGRRVMTVFDAYLEAGQVADRPIDASALPGGTYIVRISGSSFQETRSIHLLK